MVEQEAPGLHRGRKIQSQATAAAVETFAGEHPSQRIDVLKERGEPAHQTILHDLGWGLAHIVRSPERRERLKGSVLDSLACATRGTPGKLHYEDPSGCFDRPLLCTGALRGRWGQLPRYFLASRVEAKI